MTDIWIISDTHFGHANIIKYCNRPFKDPEEMDLVLRDNWNSLIKPNDIVWHLGDVYFKNQWNIPLLNGRKNLLLGNHDNGKDPVLLQNFEKIELWKEFREFGLLLTHIPVHESTLKKFNGDELLNIHGHIHDKDSPNGPWRNVSVEKTDYKPINIDELRAK